MLLFPVTALVQPWRFSQKINTPTACIAVTKNDTTRFLWTMSFCLLIHDLTIRYSYILLLLARKVNIIQYTHHMCQIYRAWSGSVANGASTNWLGSIGSSVCK